MFFCLPIGAFTAAFKHGPRQFYGVQKLQNALHRANLSQKEASIIQGLAEPQWSRQCQNVDGSHISYQRLMELPPKVLKFLAIEILTDLGVLCIEQQEIQQLHRDVVQAHEKLERLADAIEKREQLSMTLQPKADRRSA